MTHSAWIVAIVALVTFAIRLLPFLVFPEGKQPPKLISYLSEVLPAAAMGMLVVYCLKDIRLLEAPHGLPEFLSIVAVVGLHIWKRNTLLSILGGTVCYMLCIHFIF